MTKDQHTRDGQPTLKARPTTYRGIKMRSRLEAKFAALFDRCGMVWEYEPNCFADHTGQYLPDFGLLNPVTEKYGTYVEVKPPQDEEQVDKVQRRMEIIWSSEDWSVGLWLVRLDPSVPSGWTLDLGLYGQWKSISTKFPIDEPRPTPEPRPRTALGSHRKQPT